MSTYIRVHVHVAVMQDVTVLAATCRVADLSTIHMYVDTAPTDFFNRV
jgi:hypothetical protein